MNDLERHLACIFDAQPSARVVDGNEVDATEETVLSACPRLAIKTVRDCSYAALLYQDVRSAYAHEYRAGPRAGEWKQTSKEDAMVSYINRLTPNGQILRLVHFEVVWMAALVKAIARGLQEITVPFDDPACWWIRGRQQQ
jgi:hypothetical protein